MGTWERLGVHTSTASRSSLSRSWKSAKTCGAPNSMAAAEAAALLMSAIATMFTLGMSRQPGKCCPRAMPPAPTMPTRKEEWVIAGKIPSHAGRRLSKAGAFLSAGRLCYNPKGMDGWDWQTGGAGAERPRLSVIVPCHNEEANVRPLYAAVRAACAGIPLELIFVDDGST